MRFKGYLAFPPSSSPFSNPSHSHLEPRYLAMSRDLRETSTWKDISEAMQVRARSVGSFQVHKYDAAAKEHFLVCFDSRPRLLNYPNSLFLCRQQAGVATGIASDLPETPPGC